jgi:hypothetical protein
VLFAGVYDSILARCGEIDAYLYTSFSFATELLRVALMRAPRSEAVCEILHGVPSEEFDDYVALVLRHAPRAHRHRFVAQVPALPLGGAIGAATVKGPRLAVNTAANRFFLSLRARGTTLQWIDHECAWLRRQGYTGSELVITLIGAGALENDAFDAGVFAAEQALVRHVCDALREEGVPFILLYAPHPMYEGHDFRDLPLFAANRVVVCRQTLFTWLASDACLALYSSALFEAAYAGARVFTPMIADDRLYGAELLLSIDAPSAGEVCGTALRRFLRSLRTDARDRRCIAAERALLLDAHGAR